MKYWLLGLALIASPVVAQPSIRISLSEQQAYLYENDELIETAPISTGKEGYETPTGSFRIVRKQQNYYSKKYHAPMPYAQFITNYGIALHAGDLPGYAASHGCIRLPKSFARKLFDLTSIGTEVNIDE
jgi:lipoprotein-anchoring transpeptidase ErfK/SrfK